MSRYMIQTSLPGLINPTGSLVTNRKFFTLEEDVRILWASASVATPTTTGPLDWRVSAPGSLIIFSGSIAAGDHQGQVNLESAAHDIPATDQLWLSITACPLQEGTDFEISLYVEQTSPLETQGEWLVTLDGIKARLGLTGTTAEEDEFLTHWNAVASTRIRDYCGRYFNLASYVQSQTRQVGYVSVYALPLVSLTSVTIGGSPKVETDYRVTKDGALWHRQAAEDRRVYENYPVELAFDAGYDPIPYDVQELTYQAISKAWERKGTSGALGSASAPQKIVYPDGGSVTYMASLGDIMNSQDYLLGIPMAQLDHYRSQGAGMFVPSEVDLVRI